MPQVRVTTGVTSLSCIDGGKAAALARVAAALIAGDVTADQPAATED